MVAELTPEIYRSILESLHSALYVVDRSRHIVLWNQGAERVTGYLSQEVLGRRCNQDLLMHCDETNAVLCGDNCPTLRSMHDGGPHEVDLFLRHKNGERIPVRIRSLPLHDSTGALIGAVETFEERLAHHAMVEDDLDPMTGIPARAAVDQHIFSGLEALAGAATPFGVLAIAIDDFALFRRNRGVKAAEAMLQTVARTLADNLHAIDTVGHWSDDQFVAVLANCPAARLESAAVRLRRIANMASISWWGDRLSVKVSIGVAAARAGDSLESLLRRAEEARHRAQTAGGDQVIVQ